MTYKSIFLDIDGTILKPDHTYSELTKDAITQLKEQNIEVFLATGRPLHEISDIADDLMIDSLIGYNGAYAIHQNKTIVNEPMDQHIIQKLLKLSQKHEQEIIFYTRNKNFFTSLDDPLVQDFIKLFKLKENELFTNDIQDQVLGITILNVRPDQVEKYDFGKDIHLSQVNIEGFTHCYDFIQRQVNKGTAIQEVFNVLDIKKEQSIAFGDGMNDKEMLMAVGEGFAMGNAHPDLFPYAKHLTTSAAEEGIYRGLQKLGLIK